MDNRPYVVVQELTKVWEEKRISLSFSLRQGTSLALLGASGCGKSTILKMIAGLITPDHGSVFIAGTNVTHWAPARRRIGMICQDFALFPHLSLEDNIGYGLVSQGLTKKTARVHAREWMARFGLQNMETRSVTTLSHGEKQRVALARSLAVRPALILFDEALSAIDADLRTTLQGELRALQRSLGYTAVYVTHDSTEAAALADTVIHMRTQPPLAAAKNS